MWRYRERSENAREGVDDFKVLEPATWWEHDFAFDSSIVTNEVKQHRHIQKTVLKQQRYSRSQRKTLCGVPKGLNYDVSILDSNLSPVVRRFARLPR